MLPPDDPDVARLVDEVAPGSPVSDLGGCTSLNLHLHSAGLVLRVHQPFVTRARVRGLREVRRRLVARGVLVAEPRMLGGRELFTCRGRFAELEAFVPHARREATWDSYVWMYRGLGRLHGGLRDLDTRLPRPVLSTYGPPSSLRRWLGATERAVRGDREAARVAERVRQLARALDARWIDGPALPTQLVHGDVRLSNVGLAPTGETAYLDFGFAALRPRVHDLAYALAWILLRPDSRGTAEAFPWGQVRALVAAYEDAAGTRLTQRERRALIPYTAAVPLYLTAIAGYMPDPAGHLLDDTRQAFLRIGEWLLANPDAAG